MGLDCNTCARKGKVNGLSQETYCEGCIHSDKWKKDYYFPKQEKSINGDFIQRDKYDLAP